MRGDPGREAAVLRAFIRRSYPELPENVVGLPAEDEPEKRSDEDVRLVRSLQRPSLFDYQGDLVESGLRALSRGQRALLSLPTGAGKTRTAVTATLEAFARKDVDRVIWLAPSVELLDQALSTFQTCWSQHGTAPDLLLSRNLQAAPSGSVVFATPQAVFSTVRARKQLHAFQWIIFDEAHQLGARTFLAGVKALEEAGAVATGAAPPVLGLSATPGRTSDLETEELVKYFQGRLLTSARLGSNPVLSLQRRGILSRLFFEPIQPTTVTGEGRRLLAAVNKCRELAHDGRRVLVFASSVGGAVVLAEVLRSEGISASSVHSGMEGSKRDAVLSAFEGGRISVLTNQRLLATGYDCPAISDLLILGKVTSASLFEQMVGRAARGPVTGGWPSATIWQFDDHLGLHGLPQSYYRYKMYDWN